MFGFFACVIFTHDRIIFSYIVKVEKRQTFLEDLFTTDGLSSRAEDAENEIENLKDQTSNNKNAIISNDNDISSLQSRTNILEGKTNQNDYYFKYKPASE
mgnify:CR=1 FL=1